METIGVWTGNGAAPAFKQTDLLAVVHQLRSSAHVVQDPASGALGVAQGGQFMPQGMQAPGDMGGVPEPPQAAPAGGQPMQPGRCTQRIWTATVTWMSSRLLQSSRG